jgi:amidase
MEEVIKTLRDAGAEIVDPANIPSDLGAARTAELTVLRCEFKTSIAAYLATRHGVALSREGFSMNLQGLIEFNDAHADVEMPWFGQELFLGSQETGGLDDPQYADALQASRELSGPQGIDAVLQELNLDALVAPTGGPAWPIDLVNGDHVTLGSSATAAQAGYPIVSVPAGYCFGLPLNVSFIGGRFSEPTLIKLAYAFEQIARVRRPPRFLPTISYEL